MGGFLRFMLNFKILHGANEIPLLEKNVENVQELKDKLNVEPKDTDFWFENNGTILNNDIKLSEIIGIVKICYKKKLCDFENCKLKTCKIDLCCRYCEFSYCPKHKMPEMHSCSEMERCKEEAQVKNASILEQGRCYKPKI